MDVLFIPSQKTIQIIKSYMLSFHGFKVASFFINRDVFVFLNKIYITAFEHMHFIMLINQYIGL